MKYIKILIILFLVVSCSSSDDNNNASADPIIGKWSFGNTIYVASDGTEQVRLADNCDLITTIQFFSNGTGELISYVNDGTANGCELEPDNSEYNLWENLNTNTYRFTYKNIGEPEEVNIQTIEFDLTQNRMFYIRNYNGQYDGFNFVQERFQLNKEL